MVRCKRPECPCDSLDGGATYCCRTCRESTACLSRQHIAAPDSEEDEVQPWKEHPPRFDAPHHSYEPLGAVRQAYGPPCVLCGSRQASCPDAAPEFCTSCAQYQPICTMCGEWPASPWNDYCALCARHLPISRSGSVSPGRVRTSLAQTPAKCARAECMNASWNGIEGQYCSTTCAVASKILCARSGCTKTPWNGQAGQFCSHGCQQQAQPLPATPMPLPCATPMASGVPICIRPGCGKPTFNGKPGEFCSMKCRGLGPVISQSTTSVPPASPGAQKCARNGCPCDAHDGQRGSYCSMSCMNGSAPCPFYRHRFNVAVITTHQPPSPPPCAERLATSDPRYQTRFDQFNNTWAAAKGQVKQVISIFALYPSPNVWGKFEAACSNLQQLRHNANIRTMFHGCPLDVGSCTLFSSGQLCSSSSCAVCNITRNGFDRNRLATGLLSLQAAGAAAVKSGSGGFMRFGHGFYFAYNSSKSYDYTVKSEFAHPIFGRVRCMLICRVGLGKVQKLFRDDTTLTQPPPGCDAVVGEVGGGGALNYPEAIVYSDDRAVPAYAIFFNA